MTKPPHFDAIILITVSRWDQDFSSASISLARELSKNTKIFFIDNPFTWNDIFRMWGTDRIKRRIQALFFGQSIYQQIEPGNENWIAVTPLTVLPINWLPEGWLYNMFSKFNNWIFHKAIRRVIRDNNLHRFIFFNSYNPFYGYSLPGDIKPVLNIYQSRDNIREAGYVNKHGPRLEGIAARSAHIRLATSTDLVNILSSDQFPFVFFPNAADFNLFSSTNDPNRILPDELRNLKRPVIGYMGNLCERIDYDLIHKIVTHFKNCTLLLVGPRNDANHHSIDFERLENVVFTGTKNIFELPDYLAVMDCTIIPFKKNALTKSIYPLKINEYLAAGKPVVSTSFSPDIETFSEVVYLGDNHDDFLHKIELALSSDTDPKKQLRIDVAKNNSWTARGKLFWKLVMETNVTHGNEKS